MKEYTRILYRAVFLILMVSALYLTVCTQSALAVENAPGSLQFIDSTGSRITLDGTPQKVVSLVPGISEIIFRLGAGDALKGITYHTVRPWQASEKTLVGGFFQPDVRAVAMLEPDLIFYSSIHDNLVAQFRVPGCTLVNLKTGSVGQSLEIILTLGRIFNRESRAQELVENIRKDISLIRDKLSRAGVTKKRVIRLMGRDTIMTPGSDSFQNELIRLAGGIPPDFGPGDVVTVSEEEWFRFNPQIIYGCGKDTEAAEKFFSLPGWKDVEAVQNNHIYYFPCDLTCRAATQTGDFIKWLAASIYGKEFSTPQADPQANRVISIKPLDTDIPYIQRIDVKESLVHDFVNRSLVIAFNQPMQVMSTLEGPRSGIETVGNHYIPPQSWLLNHDQGLSAMRKEVLDILGLSADTASFLFTGADMNHLNVETETFKEIKVTVMATAGVASNAMRVSRDTGTWYEPGTINLIIMTNHRLTPRAMTRAIISATEGKTAALLDLDIRSSYQGQRFRATGTGTDNVMVVEGDGALLDNAGGHTKLGELIGRCVHRAVTGAIKKQNAITRGSNIFWRLKQRDITVYSMVSGKAICDCDRPMNELVAQVETLLLEKPYIGFMETAFSVSDEYEKGLIRDLTAFDAQCLAVVRMISGKPVDELRPIVTRKDVPHVLAQSLNTLFNGVYHKGKTK